MQALLNNLLTWAINLWNTNVSLALNILGQSPQEFKDGTIWKVINQINDAFVAVGVALLTLFFLVGICNESIDLKRELNVNNIVKLFLKLSFANYLVVYGIDIIQAVFKSVGAMFKMVISYNTIQGLTVPTNIEQLIKEMSWFESLLPLVLMLVIFVVILGASFTLLYIVYSRFFKVYIAVALSPLAFATFAGEGMDGTSKTFFKYVISVSLETVIIALALIICSVIIGNPPMEINDMWSLIIYLVELAFGMVLTVGLAKTSDNLIKSMFGL